VLKKERPVIRSDGSFVRDYFYVRDAVTAYMRLAERLPGDGFNGEAFNFGNETPLSVLEVVERVAATLGQPELTPIVLNEAIHEIPRQYLDCTKAKTSMGWQAQFSFEEALGETVSWYRESLRPRNTR
jgi:CDP-glucose 4,6-dehydratase